MISSTVKAAVILLFLFCMTGPAPAQSQPAKTGSISGRVTQKGNGAAGIFVGAMCRNSQGLNRCRFDATTDTDGNYRISDVAAGTYELTLASPQYVLTGYAASKTVIVADGESLEGVDFVIVRGGVITGRVTTADDQPLVEEQIHVIPVEDKGTAQPMVRLNMLPSQTDDRGIYRIFGVAPGRYTVSAGIRTEQRSTGIGGGRSIFYRQTFHPSVTDASKATVIEVTEGGEATNVDIIMGRRQMMYSVSGRIIDGETGRPIPDVRYSLTQVWENGSSSTSGPVTNALGEFKFDNLNVGKYLVGIEGSPSPVYAEPLPFEVINKDITDLVLKTSIGASISGVIVLEGMDQQKARAEVGKIQLFARTGKQRGFGGPPVLVAPDGSFKVTGLGPGVAEFVLFGSGATNSTGGFEITRVERNGEIQSGGIPIKDREQVSGVRLVVSLHTGTLNGLVKIENGQIPVERLYVSCKRVEEQTPGRYVQLDSRGRFSLKGLSAGAYEVSAIAHGVKSKGPPPSTKQVVVVADNQVSEVVLKLDLKPRDPDDKDAPY